MSQRTQSLKNSMIYKGNVVRKEEGVPVERKHRPGVKLCLERARLVTESYKETEREAEVIRKAKALANVLEKMTIYILSSQRIVGNIASDQFSLPAYPELVHKPITEALNDGFRGVLDEKGEAEWQDICQYWEGRSVDDKIIAVIPDSCKPFISTAVIWSHGFNQQKGPIVPNYEKLFKIGLKGVIEQIERRMKELEADEEISPTEYVDQKDFLEAALISCNAVVNFIKRYAVRARELAEGEKDGGRKQELEEIAGICDWVSENSPRTFYEGLQLWYFVHMITHVIESHGIGAGVRFDQLMYPLYKKDIEEGRITRDEAQELLEYLWVMLDREIGLLEEPETLGALAGNTSWQTLTIGGVTPDGEDASNELSLLLLDASMAIRTVQPTYALRYHPEINHALVLKAIDCARAGLGYPAVYNDTAVIPYIVDRGIPLQDARNWAVPLCVTWIIPGKNMWGGQQNPMIINLGKCLELVLYQGMDVRKGTQLGCITPDPTTFQSIGEVMNAYLEQVKYALERGVRISNIAELFYQRYLQRPFTSALVDDCIEQGVDCTKQTYHSNSIIADPGVINVADSLAAIKKLVFDDKAVSMEELIDACKSNFEGKEDLRQMLLNAPKFGNDDDYADSIAKEVQHRTQELVKRFKDFYGRPYTLDGSVAALYMPFSHTTGATPDGRKSKKLFADGTISPMRGADHKGPTAALKSVGKVKPTYPLLLNQRFSPQFLEGGNKELFATYLKTWAESGSWHIQFNVVDTETLCKAQEHPEDYQDLVVRVAGYSAYFVDLGRPTQDDIIARTCQTF